MNYIFIHGLGQDEKSWERVISYFKEEKFECPNVFSLANQEGLSYETLYASFAAFCNQKKGKVHLCGLSLGGILALTYAKEYPEKVGSCIVIGTPYDIPKMLFRFQNLLFQVFPKKTFQRMGLSKKSFLSLVKSMQDLDIAKDLTQISCKCLVLCGEKDRVNRKSVQKLARELPNGSLHLISNASHEVNVDNPKELADFIATFWKVK